MEIIKENNRQKYFHNLLNQILDYSICLLEKDENKQKIKKKVLDPIIDYIGGRLYPYILTTCICFILLLCIFLFIIIFVLKK